LVRPALHRFHLQELAALVMLFLGLANRYKQQYGKCNFQAHVESLLQRRKPATSIDFRGFIRLKEDSVRTITGVIGNSSYALPALLCSFAMLCGSALWNSVTSVVMFLTPAKPQPERSLSSTEQSHRGNQN